MKKKNFGSAASVLFGAIALSLAGGSAWATDCKGLDKAACEAKPECTWNDGYMRGETPVKAHCRAGKKSGKETKTESKE